MYCDIYYQQSLTIIHPPNLISDNIYIGKSSFVIKINESEQKRYLNFIYDYNYLQYYYVKVVYPISYKNEIKIIFIKNDKIKLD
jgi:hypothetical protein